MHDHWHLVWIVACGFGVAVLGALIIVYRRAAARAELDEAERILSED